MSAGFRGVIDLEATAEPTAVDLALDAFETGFEHLVKVVEDGGLDGYDDQPEWCERHHILFWADGGRTDLDNVTLLCRYHHHQFLARGWTCRMIDHLPTWTPPAWIDPHRRHLRNDRITARQDGRRLRC